MSQLSSEKIIERKLVEAVKKKGGMCIKLIPSLLIGLPDRLCLFPKGIVAFVEVKSTGIKPRPSQVYLHNKLRILGFRVEVIDTVEGVINFVEDIALSR